MDMWHRAGRIFRLSNLGTLIFFSLNIWLILAIFCPGGVTLRSAAPLLAVYIATVLISLSPAGEWFLSLLAGAKEIKRADMKIRLIPLLETVLSSGERNAPSMIGPVHLKIIYGEGPNAFALGRRTICVTDGLLQLSDQEIMALLAHSAGHLAYRHSVIQLLIGGGNLFVAGALLIVKLVCWMITGIFALIGLATRSALGTVLLTLLGGISAFLIWLWTKFCSFFLMWSARRNEFEADAYAFQLGFGIPLASLLDRGLCEPPKNGLLRALYPGNPSPDDRIARLQDLGAEYYRY